MGNLSDILCTCNLIQGDLLGDWVLQMVYATVSEVLPQNLALTKDLLSLIKDKLNDLWLAIDLQVVTMLRRDALLFTVVPSAGKPRINLAGDEATLIASDHSQLHAECKGVVHQASAWLVAVEHLLGGIEVVEPRHLPQHRHVVRGKLNKYLPLLLSDDLN